MNNLATILILRGGRDRLAEAVKVNARAWRLKAGRHEISSVRILRLRIVLLNGSDASHYLGQFKTLLAASSLGNVGNVVMKRDCASLMRWISEQSDICGAMRDLFAGLMRVINCEADIDTLDAHTPWREAPALPLTAPWPELSPSR